MVAGVAPLEVGSDCFIALPSYCTHNADYDD